MKAIILTHAPVKESDIQPLIDTDIHKYAINGHAEYLKPTYRICSDYGVIGYLLEHFQQDIITTREYAQNRRLIYAGHITFKGSTIISAIEYLIWKKYKSILIIGDNTVHTEIFQKRINTEMNKILQDNSDVEIFQYTKGNFELQIKTVQQFLKERE